ncbi:chromosome segregation protein SMC [bacterium]|nr:chromosome segregation protein SMC [bacterium]
MYLKSLELMGFKSFGHKTVFDFQPGITAIIGPNGSGKSNICDAIRWVLGEQSAKTLRGNKMTEVIFAGSKELRSAQFAQVKLILDNIDKQLPIEEGEVSFGRQLFRSGESNYFFNENKSLLSNLREILMDTGIGKDGYSVIGQGDIDDIIFQRIQSRRALIEEAAGITKFKHRKTSALQKLFSTQENITRLGDIIVEIESQLGPLGEQAEKTRKYQALSNEIQALEIDLTLFDLSRLFDDRENVESMRRGLISKLDELSKFLEEIGNKKLVIRDQLVLFEDGLRNQQKNIREATQAVDEIKNSISSNKEELRSHQARREAILEEMASLEEELFKTIQEIKDAEERLADGDSAQVNIQGRVSEIDGNISLVQNELSSHLREISQDKESSFQIAVLLTEKRNQFTTHSQQIQMLERQLEKGEGDINSLNAEIAKIETEIKRLEVEIGTLEQEISSSTNSLSEDKNRLQKVEKQLGNTEDEVSAINEQIKICHAQRNLLEEMRNRGDGGIFRGVREVLSLKSQGTKGIFGMVGDLLTVPRGYEIAFEVALGGNIQDIVTADADTAQKVIGILKERKAGRATFLPLDLIQAPSRLEKFLGKGCLGVAIDLIEYDAKFTVIMNHLLGRTLIFENLDSAILFSKQNRNFGRIVTLEGELIRSSGAMTGGNEGGKSSGLLSRKRDIEELEQKAASLENREKKCHSLLSNLRNERNSLLSSVRRHEENVARKTQSLDFFKASKEKLNYDFSGRQLDHKRIGSDFRELQSERNRLSASREQVQNELSAIETQNRDITKKLSELSGKEDGIQIRLKSLHGLLEDERLSLAQVVERKKAVKKEIDSASKRRKTSEDRRIRAEGEAHRLAQLIESLGQDLLKMQGLLVQSESQKQSLESSLESSQEKYRLLSRELETLDRTYVSRAKIEDSTKNKLGEQNIRLAEINTHIHNKETILTEKFNFDINEVGSYPIKFNSREELTDLIKCRIEEKDELEPVNPLAIEDYEKTKERSDFLKNQVTDLTEAAGSLEQVIQEIEKISCERFLETFSHINSAFSEIFQVLFPGGSGVLKVSLPENPLESNVEISCSLPGRKLASIELFSGGERALIALALLFAILQVKPPAFCVLDEVEASLDESNVVRFTRLLQNFSGKTQFLIITHNKETMQVVDVLYGITMEKSGISKPVSIRLEDHDKIKEFTVKK